MQVDTFLCQRGLEAAAAPVLFDSDTRAGGPFAKECGDMGVSHYRAALFDEEAASTSMIRFSLAR